MASPLNPTRVHVAQVHEDLKKDATKRQAPAEWQGSHPWRPWDREKDLDIRAANPKGKESVLNNQHMGTLGDRFGGGKRETTFM